MAGNWSKKGGNFIKRSADDGRFTSVKSEKSSHFVKLRQSSGEPSTIIVRDRVGKALSRASIDTGAFKGKDARK